MFWCVLYLTVVSYGCRSIQAENVVNEDGYHFSFKTEDTERSETGSLDPGGKEEEDRALRVQGVYAFVAPNGNKYRVNYVADENGYRAKFSLVGARAPESTTHLPDSEGEINFVSFGLSPAALATLAGGGLG